MDTKDQIRKDLRSLQEDAIKLMESFTDESKKTDLTFHLDYQDWYTRALRAIEFMAPDRLDEFKSYYEINPKRKSLGYSTYVIQDYIKGVVPSSIQYPDFDSEKQTSQNLYNQFSILSSLYSRIDSVLANAETSIYSEIQDSEIAAARNLLTINHRAAGVIAGVLLEGYLLKIAQNHKITIRKKNPTISDLNDLLKQSLIYNTPTWRKVSYFADIRNLCSHKRKDEPTIEQVKELIDGVNWVVKNIV